MTRFVPHRRSFCALVVHAMVAALLVEASPVSVSAAAPSPRREPPRVRRITSRELDPADRTRLFARPLAAWGEGWVRSDGRRVWRPADVPARWQPYLDGSWAWTTEGWYWVSPETLLLARSRRASSPSLADAGR